MPSFAVAAGRSNHFLQEQALLPPPLGKAAHQLGGWEAAQGSYLGRRHDGVAVPGVGGSLPLAHDADKL